MKSIIILVLCSSLLLEGCASYCPVLDRDRPEIIASNDQHLKVMTLDGSKIQTLSEHYLFVSDSSSFVFGDGSLISKNGRIKPFVGKIHPRGVDSLEDAHRLYYVYAVDESTTVRFMNQDCFTVDGRQGPGFWYIGERVKDGSKQMQKGRIPIDSIKEIRVSRADGGKTALFVAGSLAFLAGMVGISVATWSGH